MTDVFVIGGGPAGLAAAIAARLRGFEVTVADAARPPIDKACGEGLMPASSAALRELGIRVDAEQALPFRGIRFDGDGVAVQADFSRGAGLGMRRTRLHQLLVDRADELGVSLRWGTTVASLSELRCRWIVGADGQNSRVRRWAGLESARSEPRRFGFRQHYRVAPWSDVVEVYWLDGCQVYVTPSSGDEVCVALLTRDPHVRLAPVLSRLPALQRRLAGAVPASAESGSVTVSRRLRRVFRGNTVLIGDASGSVDAIAGEGLSLAFHQALALADALAAGDLEAYQTRHRQLARRPALMARLLLTLDRSPWLRRRALRAMAATPSIFAGLLALHGSVAGFKRSPEPSNPPVLDPPATVRPSPDAWLCLRSEPRGDRGSP